MFKLHTLSTNRQGGKTTHLITQINELIMSSFVNNTEFRALVLTCNNRISEYVKGALPFIAKNNSLIYGTFDGFEMKCRGMHYDAFFVDEYQFLTPSQMDMLFAQAVLCGIKDMYLVGDLQHTADLFRNTTEATESLKRENKLLRAEIDRLR